MFDESIDPDVVVASIIRTLADWQEGKRCPKGKINPNVFCAGLYITEALRSKFPLSQSDYLTASQVKGASGKNAANILARHDETRPFLKEGGRTSRATRPTAIELAELLNSDDKADKLKQAPAEVLDHAGRALQAWFVRQIQTEFFAKERIKAEIRYDKPARVTVKAILEAANANGGNTAGAVAQHLVGAKLALRFPDVEINNESYTTADQQTDRPGDFHVGDTAIHVTMRPVSSLFETRCLHNINHGYRPRVLVPESDVAGAQLMAKNVSDRIAVQSIEDFVGTNVEEMAGFTADGVKSGLRSLLEKYNERVLDKEPDPGLLIEIPMNL
ncbi:MAG: DUF4928 family protein [Saccharothrix sp.]|nr:DUF4928 family protein [Saccharothrix sp.]